MSQRPTILDYGDGIDTRERCQSAYRALWAKARDRCLPSDLRVIISSRKGEGFYAQIHGKCVKCMRSGLRKVRRGQTGKAISVWEAASVGDTGQLTGVERTVYDVSISFGLPSKPETSRNRKSRLRCGTEPGVVVFSQFWMATPPTSGVPCTC